MEVKELYSDESVYCASQLFPWIERHVAWALRRYCINKSNNASFRVIAVSTTSTQEKHLYLDK